MLVSIDTILGAISIQKGDEKMVDNLAKLHNTLLMIETKGESTKIMAECLRFLEQMIVEEKKQVNSTEPVKE